MNDKYHMMDIRLNMFSTLLHDMLGNMKEQNEASAKMNQTLMDFILCTQRGNLITNNNNDEQTNLQTFRTQILETYANANGKSGDQNGDVNHKRKAVAGNDNDNMEDNVILSLSSDDDLSNTQRGKKKVVGEQLGVSNEKPQIPLEWLGGKSSTTKKQGAPSGSKSDFNNRSKTKQVHTLCPTHSFNMLLPLICLY